MAQKENNPSTTTTISEQNEMMMHGLQFVFFFEKKGEESMFEQGYIGGESVRAQEINGRNKSFDYDDN